ncbi:hypothetical protein Tco_1390586 [Tanacetum coccineum]
MYVHNIYSFYESESSKSEDMGQIDIETLTMENKDDDAYKHVEKVLEITSLFNIYGISKDVIMLRVFPITLTGAVKRWMGRVPARTVNTPEKGLEIPTRRMLDFYGLIPGMTATRALVVIQEMADHSQKWHDGGSIRGLGGSSSNGTGIITNKLSDLGKNCFLKEEVKRIKATGYGE